VGWKAGAAGRASVNDGAELLAAEAPGALAGGEAWVGEGRKAGAGGAAKDGAELLVPEVPPLAGALAGKLENPP